MSDEPRRRPSPSDSAGIERVNSEGAFASNAAIESKTKVPKRLVALDWS
ncbi:MAG: hypothetical protein ACJ79S_01445 [Gemmatimonadaceae bacterium]